MRLFCSPLAARSHSAEVIAAYLDRAAPAMRVMPITELATVRLLGAGLLLDEAASASILDFDISRDEHSRLKQIQKASCGCVSSAEHKESSRNDLGSCILAETKKINIYVRFDFY